MGHYLGVDRDRQRRALDDALQEDAPALHEPLAEKMRAATPYRFRLVRYAALGE